MGTCGMANQQAGLPFEQSHRTTDKGPLASLHAFDHQMEVI
jgi:hypothetical protein